MDLELYALLEIDRNLAENLRQLRLSHHMTVEEMAILMELSPEAITAIENRQHPEELHLSHLENITRQFPWITPRDLLMNSPEEWWGL